MPWKEISLEDLAKSLGANLAEIREKQKLIDLIIKVRRKRHLSQASLAKRLSVTQSRIAQIESGIGTSKITFDVLLGILINLGYDFHIVIKEKVAA